MTLPEVTTPGATYMTYFVCPCEVEQGRGQSEKHSADSKNTQDKGKSTNRSLQPSAGLERKLETLQWGIEDEQEEEQDADDETITAGQPTAAGFSFGSNPLVDIGGLDPVDAICALLGNSGRSMSLAFAGVSSPPPPLFQPALTVSTAASSAQSAPSSPFSFDSSTHRLEIKDWSSGYTGWIPATIKRDKPNWIEAAYELNNARRSCWINKNDPKRARVVRI